jgi:hypothetical protein
LITENTALAVHLGENPKLLRYAGFATSHSRIGKARNESIVHEYALIKGGMARAMAAGKVGSLV